MDLVVPIEEASVVFVMKARHRAHHIAQTKVHEPEGAVRGEKVRRDMAVINNMLFSEFKTCEVRENDINEEP